VTPSRASLRQQLIGTITIKSTELRRLLSPRRLTVVNQRKDERRDRFLRKKKFKKIKSASKLKDTKRDPDINNNNNIYFLEDYYGGIK
jgi:Trm5-related predicted tRNA methylase